MGPWLDSVKVFLSPGHEALVGDNSMSLFVALMVIVPFQAFVVVSKGTVQYGLLPFTHVAPVPVAVMVRELCEQRFPLHDPLISIVGPKTQTFAQVPFVQLGLMLFVIAEDPDEVLKT